jgi:glycosyltransferase involved in cell wall biosynthesis
VGRHFLDLAQGLAAAGVEVTGIYSPDRIDHTFGQRVSTCDALPMVELPLQHGVGPGDLAGMWRLARRIKQLGPFHLIHGHSSKAGALARLAARWLHTPVVYTPHAFITLDPTMPTWKRTFYGQVERRLARMTDAIIAVSEDEADHMRTLGIDERVIHVVPNGIAQLELPARDVVRARLGISPAETVVGFVGRLARQKAPELLIDAFALADREPDKPMRLLIVGSGPLEECVRQRIAERKLASRVTLLGDVVATQIMPAFDIFCLPSRYEAMPYVYLEALAAGLPIVSTRVGGTSLCVTPGTNGLVVEPENVPALAAALATLIRDTDLRQRFASASTVAASRFTLDRMVTQTLDVYARVAGHERPEQGIECPGHPR